MKRFIWSAILMSVTVCGSSLQAADTTKTLPTKKFKLHKFSVQFKTSEMAAERVIPHPEYQKPGGVLGDAVRYRAVFSPDLTLPSDRYAWTGAGSGPGPLMDISYPSVTDSQVNVSVLDKNSNSLKSVSVQTSIRSVGTETEGGICITVNPILQAQCAVGALDSETAIAWANSPQTGTALSDPFRPAIRDNGKTNAARHSYWNALMARDLGQAVAERFATAHEKLSITLNSGVDAGGAHNGSVMDLGNNARGRLIAAGLNLTPDPGEPSAAIEGVIIDDINNGNMTILDDIDNAGNAGLLQTSDRPQINTP